MTTVPDSLLRRLEWHVLRRLDGQVQGAYRTVQRGNGLDFTGLREYTPEDDVRHIDWNVTARLDEPYVRQYTEDRELTAWLVLDRSASMRFGEHGKDALLSELAICLGRLFTKAGNRVGAILYDNQRLPDAWDLRYPGQCSSSRRPSLVRKLGERRGRQCWAPRTAVPPTWRRWCTSRRPPYGGAR